MTNDHITVDVLCFLSKGKHVGMIKSCFSPLHQNYWILLRRRTSSDQSVQLKVEICFLFICCWVTSQLRPSSPACHQCSPQCITYLTQWYRWNLCCPSAEDKQCPQVCEQCAYIIILLRLLCTHCHHMVWHRVILAVMNFIYCYIKQYLYTVLLCALKLSH